MAVLPPFFITNVGRFPIFLPTLQGKGGGGEGRGDFVGLKVFNRIFSRFQKDFQGLLESALDVWTQYFMIGKIYCKNDFFD